MLGLHWAWIRGQQVPLTDAAASKIKPRRWDANAVRLFLCGLAALYWELVLIRWLGTNIRVVAYFSNLVLISAFFGLGAGALLTRFSVRLERFIVPLVAMAVLLGIWLGRLWHPNPTDGGDYIWIGAPFGIANPGAEAAKFISVGVVLFFVYGITAAVFAVFGQFLGRLFKTRSPLSAYSIEIAGSLAGIALFALLSLGQTTPTVWVGVGVLLLLLMLPWRPFDAVLTALLGAILIAAVHPESQRYVWTPYYRISVEPITRLVHGDVATDVKFPEPVGNVLEVNNDFHQMMLDLRPRLLDHPFLSGWRAFYDAPYASYNALADLPPGPILIVGAGTGNDVAAALRQTDRSVTAVEIDPGIAELGRRLHSERPYANSRVTLVIDDARAYFHRAPSDHYAAVVFGFLDSHRLLSAFSSVRLDNFVYTREAMNEVRRLLAPGGRVAISFASNRPWIHARMIALLNDTFSIRTLVLAERSSYVNGLLYLNQRAFQGGERSTRSPPSELVPTDDWPFLYLRQRSIPEYNALFLLLAAMLSLAALLVLPQGERRIRLPYFFLGAAFFLLETSNVVRMALLYGSTWWVNTVVFAGVLVLVLFSNLTASVWKVPIRVCVLLLTIEILIAAVLPSEQLLCLGPWTRAVVAVAVFLGPVYFGGLIFARLIESETRLFEAYGSNVLGAVLGGTVEYLSLVLGLSSLLAAAALFYLAVFLLLRRGVVSTSAAAS